MSHIPAELLCLLQPKNQIKHSSVTTTKTPDHLSHAPKRIKLKYQPFPYPHTTAEIIDGSQDALLDKAKEASLLRRQAYPVAGIHISAVVPPDILDPSYDTYLKNSMASRVKLSIPFPSRIEKGITRS